MVDRSYFHSHCVERLGMKLRLCATEEKGKEPGCMMTLVSSGAVTLTLI